MAEPDPGKPQVTDPDTVADLIRLLAIRGTIGFLDVADIVIPTVSLGSVVQQTVRVDQPAFRSTDVFSAGQKSGAGVNTVHADTGQLPAGTYDLILLIAGLDTVSRTQWVVQHRNATNAANLMTFPLDGASKEAASTWDIRFGYEVAVNERLRVLNVIAFAAGQKSAATIFARIR